MKTILLNELYEKYDIANLKFGKIHDKLGDVFEEYCVRIMENGVYLNALKNCDKLDSVEYDIFVRILDVFNVSDYINIQEIKASDPVPVRMSHGLSKTDVIIHVIYDNGDVKDFPLSCKQSTVKKVAFAEFDVDTICDEMRIEDGRLKDLMLKHQVDKSAKNFTSKEKAELKELLSPRARDFVRWVVTGSPDKENNDLRIPTALIKFTLKKPSDRNDIDIMKGDFDYLGFSVSNIEDYIDGIMLNKKGIAKTGGFGTGLSWTYATGSGGYKIQFKC